MHTQELVILAISKAAIALLASKKEPIKIKPKINKNIDEALIQRPSLKRLLASISQTKKKLKMEPVKAIGNISGA